MADATGDWGMKWELLVADTWDDPQLKQRLLTDTATVLTERGISAPEGVSIKIVEEAQNETTLVLPAASVTTALSDSELESVSGGASQPAIHPKKLDGLIDKIPGR